MAIRTLAVALFIIAVTGQDASNTTSPPLPSNTAVAPSVTPVGSTITNPSIPLPSGTYMIDTGTQVLAQTVLSSSGNSSINGTSSTSNSLQLVGVAMTSTMTGNTTATATASSATPTNTQPCNGYPEFCGRKYSNITEIGAHNAPFVRKNNVFSNQNVLVQGQLNDGIRLIQNQVHFENNTLYNCHSDCEFLNVGPYVNTLNTISTWLGNHPYDVVTILIGNANGFNVTEVESAFQSSGLLDYIYLPSRRPMRLADWPTLEEMILTNARVVVFMDYGADADAVPYVLDEFSNMWETPYSPTNTDFPCSQQRPPGLSEDDARNVYLYTANHNLNVQIALGGSDVLIPNFASLATTNANNASDSSLASMADRCVQKWNRPPKFLLVDFYDVSAPVAGGVFQVAAEMNNVTYTGTCCGENLGFGSDAVRAAMTERSWSLLGMGLAVLVTVWGFVI